MKLFKARYFLAVYCTLWASAGLAQECFPIFHKQYGAAGSDEALNILYCADKGSLVVGRTTSGTGGDYDGFIMKLSESGAIEWSKNYGASGYDELTKIVAANDGGYLATGQTASFNNKNGEPFIIKIDSKGAVRWAKTLITENTAKHRLSDAIELKDGSIALLINLRDSLPAADAMITKLTATGNVAWSVVFDNGDEDAWNAIAADNDSLVLIGHAKINGYLKAILTNMNAEDGKINWSKSVNKVTTEWENSSTIYETDGINIAVDSGKFIFSTTYFEGNHIGLKITDLKMLKNGNIIYERFTEPATLSSDHLETIYSLPTEEGGFAHLYQETEETGEFGYPEFTVLNNAGNQRTRRPLFDNFQPTKFYGVDKAGQEGFLLAGYTRLLYPLTPFKIKVLKTDNNASWGPCSPLESYSYIDSVHHRIDNFKWLNIQPGNHALSPLTAAITGIDNYFTVTAICSDKSCHEKTNPVDSCINTFHLRLRSDASLNLYDAEPLTDGSHIVAGTNEYFGTLEPVIACIKPDGTTAWANYYAHFQDYGFFKKVITTSDGKQVILGINGTELNHGIGYNSVIMKVDNAGNTIWEKTYNNFNLYDGIPTQDGGLITVGNYAWGGAGIQNYLIRLNSTGGIVWKKQIFHTGFDPIYKAMYLDGNDLYISADSYQNGIVFKIEKYNALTGDMIWNHLLATENEKVLSVKGVCVINDTLYAYMLKSYRTGVFSSKTTVMVVAFNKAGGEIHSYEIDSHNFQFPKDFLAFNEHSPTMISRTADNNLIVAGLTDTTGESLFEIIKFSPTGKLIWDKKYRGFKNYQVLNIKPGFDKILITGIIPKRPVDYNQQRSFILKIDKNGNISDSATGNCLATNGQIHIQPVPPMVAVLPDRFDFIRNEPWIEARDYPQTKVPVYISAAAACKQPSLCSISISGQDSICDASNDYTYTIKRNKECTALPVWIADSTALRIIEHTDSTIQVQFLKAGPVQIKAILSTGCGILQSNKTIWVEKQETSTLNLGFDTVICTGNTIKLSAGTGFVSYRWQDETKDSLYTVTKAGTYHISATTGCGAVLTDTIIVKDTGDIAFSVGNDLQICSGDTAIITATPGFINYSWQPAYNLLNTAATAYIYPFADTAYTVKAEKMPGCFVYDTVRIIVKHGAAIYLGRDTSFCRGDSLVLKAGNEFMSYSWNTGAATNHITVSSAGSYIITATNYNGCLSLGTLVVRPLYELPGVNLQKITALCMDDSIILDAGGNGNTYDWSNGSNSRYITVNSTGSYAVQVTDQNGCMNSDTAAITNILSLPTAFLPADTSICNYSAIRVTSLKSYRGYLWSTGETSADIMLNSSGYYWLQVTDNDGCVGRDTIFLTPKDCMLGVYIPTAFSPNGDGKNELFKPLVYGNLIGYQFLIYNRFGQLIFSTSEAGKGWDGKYKGADQPSQAYVWKCNYQLSGGNKKTEKGTVVLVR